MEQLSFGIIQIVENTKSKNKRSASEEKLHLLRVCLKRRITELEELLGDLDVKSQGYYMVEGSLLAYMAIKDMIDEERNRDGSQGLQACI